jgi:hypothetical protein
MNKNKWLRWLKKKYLSTKNIKGKNKKKMNKKTSINQPKLT